MDTRLVSITALASSVDLSTSALEIKDYSETEAFQPLTLWAAVRFGANTAGTPFWLLFLLVFEPRI
jgi:hypothetical protein